jgi:hypothetical protein
MKYKDQWARLLSCFEESQLRKRSVEGLLRKCPIQTTKITVKKPLAQNPYPENVKQYKKSRNEMSRKVLISF